jgi:hypothetical protein
MDEMDSEYGNIWSREAGEWFCPNGHEIGIKDEPCEDCIEDARNEIPDAPTRTDMLSDLAEYGILHLEALDDAGVKKMHDKWYPEALTPAEERLVAEMNRDFNNAAAFGKMLDGLFDAVTVKEG